MPRLPWVREEPECPAHTQYAITHPTYRCRNGTSGIQATDNLLELNNMKTLEKVFRKNVP